MSVFVQNNRTSGMCMLQCQQNGPKSMGRHKIAMAITQQRWTADANKEKARRGSTQLLSAAGWLISTLHAGDGAPVMKPRTTNSTGNTAHLRMTETLGSGTSSSALATMWLVTPIHQALVSFRT